MTGELVRVGAAFGALAAGAAAVIVVASLILGLPAVNPTSGSATGTPGSVSSPAPATPTGSARKVPGPPNGAIVLGGNASTDAVGLAVVPGRRVLFQVSVVDESGNGVDGLPVRIHVRGRGGQGANLRGRACGSGCYRAFADVLSPRGVSVSLGPLRTSFVLPEAWPPPFATVLVGRATHVYKSLHSFIIHDELGDGREAVRTVFRIVAPDRLSYVVEGGGSAIIIGDRRWDMAEGSKRWSETPQAPITQPTPFWVDAIDARILGTARVAGRAAWKVSFYDPVTPAWFTLLIDKANLRTLDMRMTAHSHFMHDTYGAFDAPLTISPPG